MLTRLGAGLGPNYWKLWSASAASNLADGVFWIAFPLFAIQLTDSPALIAGVTVVARLPWLLFVLVAGALADRLDRRRTMVAVAVFRTLVAGSLALGIAAGSSLCPFCMSRRSCWAWARRCSTPRLSRSCPTSSSGIG
jgi:MFS family permease